MSGKFSYEKIQFLTFKPKKKTLWNIEKGHYQVSAPVMPL